MKVINPTDKAITINYKQDEYTVPANGSVSGVTKEAATYWKERLHNFLTVEAEDEVATDVSVKEEAPKEEVKEVKVEKKIIKKTKKVVTKK